MRTAESRSATARRTSSCAKRYAEPDARTPRRASPLGDRLVDAASSASVRDDRRAPERVELEAPRRRRPRARAPRCVSGARRASRWLDDLAHGRRRAELGRRPTRRAVPAAARSPSESTSSRQSSVRRNALPPVSSDDRRAQLADGSAPAARRTNSPISALGQPAEPDPDDALGRETSTSVVGEARRNVRRGVANVATISMRASAPARTRCRRRSSVGASAQCTSSSTSRTGDAPAGVRERRR